jgi:hypothetical protein
VLARPHSVVEDQYASRHLGNMGFTALISSIVDVVNNVFCSAIIAPTFIGGRLPNLRQSPVQRPAGLFSNLSPNDVMGFGILHRMISANLHRPIGSPVA